VLFTAIKPELSRYVERWYSGRYHLFFIGQDYYREETI
jgi:hypothetical protein